MPTSFVGYDLVVEKVLTSLEDANRGSFDEVRVKLLGYLF